MDSKINVSRNAEGTVSNVSVYQDYRYGGLTVITFMDSLEKWFLADEICDKLGYKVSSRQKILSRLSSLDKLILKPKNMNNFKCDKLSHLKVPNRGRLLINLHGLVILANNSELPNARQYQDWVYSTITYIEDHGHYEDATLADSMDRMNLLFNPTANTPNPVVINQVDHRVIDIGIPPELREGIINLAFYMTFSRRADELAPVSRDIPVNYLWLAYQCGGVQGRESVVTNIKFIIDKLSLGWPLEELEMRLGNAFYGFTSMYSIPDGPGFQRRLEEHKESRDPGRIRDDYKEVTEEDHGFSYADYVNNMHNYQFCDEPSCSYDSSIFSSVPRYEEKDEYSQYRKSEYDEDCYKSDMNKLFKVIEELNNKRKNSHG